MGVFVSIRGWVEACDEQVPLIRALIERDEDQIGHYADSWCFQTVGGGSSRFVFFGCTVRDAAVVQVRAQVRRIAQTVFTHDGPHVDYPQGDFLLEHESHESEPERYPLTRWRFARGVFLETGEGEV
jgi:hypothetical protein